jgi:hypothetical protein
VKRTLLISGALARVPGNGGLAWFHLQLLLGLRRLGWDVLFLDWVRPDECVDAGGRAIAPEASANARWLGSVMRRFGLGEAWSLDVGDGRTLGAPREHVLRAAGEAPLLLNVMGYTRDDAVLSRVRRRVFVDIDPGFPQMWRELGLHDALAGHDAFVTMGMNVGKPGCAVPTCGVEWVTMPQPVVLEHWPVMPPSAADDAAPFTSIGAWRGPNAPVEFGGRTYGLRAHEFRRFVELPRECPAERFEMAFEIHPGDAKDRDALLRNGWTLADPRAVADTPENYRNYVARSRAEFMVPKQMYVATNGGLLSDRSAYYLASGRPVLARDTGLAGLYPVGKGLLTFETPGEAIDGVAEIRADFRRHAAAAREVAEECFDSDKVLRRLVGRLGVDS